MSDSTTPDVTGASQSTPTPAKASPSGAPTQFSGAPPVLPLLPTQPLSLPILGAPRPHPPSPWFAAAVQDRLRTGALPTLLQPDYSTPPPSATPASQRRSGGGGSHRPWWGFSEGDDVNIPEPRQGDAGAAAGAGRARATQSDAPAASLGSQDTLPGDRTREEEGVEESTAERDEAGGGSGGGGGGGRGAPSSWWQSQDESQAGHGQGQFGGSQAEPMDTREAGDRSKVARSLFEDTPGGVQRQRQQQQQQQPSVSRRAVVSITMEQAGRAEANRQAALAKRRQRLEAQAINLFAAQPTGTPPPREQTSKIYNELNRVLTAQRRGPAPPPPSPGPSPPAPSSQQGAPLTPEQRERMERSRQAALQRQAERAAAEAAAIMARAEREGQRVRQERANAARAASQQQQQQQQRPSPSKDIDQSWQRFVP